MSHVGGRRTGPRALDSMLTTTDNQYGPPSDTALTLRGSKRKGTGPLPTRRRRRLSQSAKGPVPFLLDPLKGDPMISVLCCAVLGSGAPASCPWPQGPSALDVDA